MDINYFDFLKMFPEIIDNSELPTVDISYYINYVEEMHDSGVKNPLIKIDNNKFSKLVLNAKETNDEKYDILRGYLRIKIDNDIIEQIKHTEELTNFEVNNLNEIEGNFNITSHLNTSKYYYFNDTEMKNVKRSLLISKCLDGKTD